MKVNNPTELYIDKNVLNYYKNLTGTDPLFDGLELSLKDPELNNKIKKEVKLRVKEYIKDEPLCTIEELDGMENMWKSDNTHCEIMKKFFPQLSKNLTKKKFIYKDGYYKIPPLYKNKSSHPYLTPYGVIWDILDISCDTVVREDIGYYFEEYLNSL